MSIPKDISPAMYENSHVLEELLSSTDEREKNEAEFIDEVKIFNNWTKENEDTVKKWQLDIEKSSFIYSELLNKTTKKISIVTTSSLIISSLITLFSGLSVALAFLDVKTVALVFTIIILSVSSLDVILNGLMKVHGWNNDVQILSPFVEKLSSTWYNFEIELNISAENRSNATDFLRRYDGHYMALMQQCPSISREDYIEANRKYQKNLFDNYMWSQRFRKSMIKQLEEVV